MKNKYDKNMKTWTRAPARQRDGVQVNIFICVSYIYIYIYIYIYVFFNMFPYFQKMSTY